MGAREVTRRALLLCAIVLTACAGPKPEVESVRVERVEGGKAFVTLAVRNRGGGDGQATVDVTLRDGGGNVVARDEVDVDLRPHERVRVAREIPIAGAKDVVAEAEARYPP